MASVGRGRARRQLTLEAQFSLAHSAWGWASAAVLLRRPRSTTHDQWDFSQLVIIQTVDSIEWERYTRGLHMLCLALGHLDRCLELLASSRVPPDFPHRSCREFRRAWRPLSDLRDVLEHEEDYVAGGGRKPSLVAHDVHGWINIRGVQVPTRPHQETRNADAYLLDPVSRGETTTSPKSSGAPRNWLGHLPSSFSRRKRGRTIQDDSSQQLQNAVGNWAERIPFRPNVSPSRVIAVHCCGMKMSRNLAEWF